MPGWEGSTRRADLPADWHVTQPRILRRDGYQCQHIRQDTGRLCLRRARDVDHIISHVQGGGDDDNNLQALCGYHHDQKSGREGGIASGVSRRAKRQASKPLHPGLLPQGGTNGSRAVRDGGDEPAPF